MHCVSGVGIRTLVLFTEYRSKLFVEMGLQFKWYLMVVLLNGSICWRRGILQTGTPPHLLPHKLGPWLGLTQLFEGVGVQLGHL